MTSKTTQWALWFLFLMMIGVAVFFVGIQIPYYLDDNQFVFDASSPKPLYHYFYNNHVENGYYRPLQASLILLVQRHCGLNTLPIHLVQISIHILLSWLVYVSIHYLGFTRVQAAIGSLFMLVSQANVCAVLSNDTLSQVGGTLSGSLALWLIYLFYIDSPSRTHCAGKSFAHRNYFLSIIALALCYLFKESGISFIIMVLAIIALFNSQRKKAPAFIHFLRSGFPFLLLTVLYLVVRSYVAQKQPSFGSGNYDFHIGANLIVNTAMLLFAASIPTSSVDVFVAFRSGDLNLVLVVVGATVLFLLVVAYGLWACRKSYKTFLVLGAFAVMGLFPMVIMNHVSELYAYNSMPFISVLVGVGLGKCLELSKKHWVTYIAVTPTIVALFTSHIVAVERKALMMRECGERASTLLNEIEPYTSKIPGGGKLLLVNPPDHNVEYSVFLIKGYGVLKHGFRRINQVCRRNDFSTQIIEVPDVDKQKDLARCCLALSLSSDGMIQVYQPSTKTD